MRSARRQETVDNSCWNSPKVLRKLLDFYIVGIVNITVVGTNFDLKLCVELWQIRITIDVFENYNGNCDFIYTNGKCENTRVYLNESR